MDKGVIVGAAALALITTVLCHGGVLKRDSYVVYEPTGDTVAIINTDAEIQPCTGDTVEGLQRVKFRGYIRPEDELLGKVKLSTTGRDALLARISDTVELYQDSSFTKRIGKAWKSIGVRSVSRGISSTALGFRGVVDVTNLTYSKPWQHCFGLCGVRNPLGLTRQRVTACLERVGMSPGEAWQDDDFTVEYVVVGCDAVGTVKAILVYSNDSLAAYWSEEELPVKPAERLNGKNLYCSKSGARSIKLLKRRICEDCRGAIGVPLQEGCQKECQGSR